VISHSGFLGGFLLFTCIAATSTGIVSQGQLQSSGAMPQQFSSPLSDHAVPKASGLYGIETHAERTFRK
jgi:hypothetical protein